MKLILLTMVVTSVTLFVWLAFVSPSTSTKAKKILKPFNIVLHILALVLNIAWANTDGDYFLVILLCATGIIAYLNYRSERLNGLVSAE